MTYSVPGLGWPEDATTSPGSADDLSRSDAEIPIDADARDAEARDAETEAWLRQLAGGAEVPRAGFRENAPTTVTTGALPDRYARRAARIGLGWPRERSSTGNGPTGDIGDAGTAAGRSGETEVSGADVRAPQDSADAGPARAAASQPMGTGASNDNPDGADVEAGLGSDSAPQRSEPTPARVRQALAAVSRETGRLTPPTPIPDSAVSGSAVSGSAVSGSAVPGSAVPGSAVPESAVPESAEGWQTIESEESVAIPAVPDASADTPIGRAAQAAVVARSGGQTWPRPSSCRIITIANQKGGVGKTTTAVNLAASLAMHGARVLVIDLDPQGNASTALDVEHHSGIRSVYNVLVDGEPLTSVVRPVAGFPHLYCAPATIDLAGAEIELVPLVAREARLSRAVGSFDLSNLDYLFIDCPPSLGLLTVNALVAAPEVLIPIQCEYYALEGLEQLLRTIDLVRSHLNPTLAVTAILLTMYDGRTRLASQVADEVREHFGGIVLGSVIPRSVRVSEAPSYGQSVMTYDPGSSGAVAYLEAARELAQRNLQQQAAG
jgi:chromosome partitioning protein